MTKLLVLGLLDGGPMSGYDLQQKLGGADAERWGGVLPGSCLLYTSFYWGWTGCLGSLIRRRNGSVSGWHWFGSHSI